MPVTLDIKIDPKLLDEARSLDIDVEAEITTGLRARIEQRRRQIAWQEQNRDAIEAWNDEIDRNGLWYERIRTR